MSKAYGKSLLEEMARQHSLPLPLLKEAAHTILDVIRDGLIADGVVKVSNFGTFRLKPVAERRGINPHTREPLIIPAHQRVIFTPCKALRELIYPLMPASLPAVPESDVYASGEEQIPANKARNAAIPVTTNSIPVGEQSPAAVTKTTADTRHSVVPQAISHDEKPDERVSAEAPQVVSRSETPDEHVSAEASLTKSRSDAPGERVNAEVPLTESRNERSDGHIAADVAQSLSEDDSYDAEASGKISIDMGRLDEVQQSPPSSRKRYLVTAAVIATLLVSALLLMEPSSTGKEPSHPVASHTEEPGKAATTGTLPEATEVTTATNETAPIENAQTVLSKSEPTPAPNVTTEQAEQVEQEQAPLQQHQSVQASSPAVATANSDEVFFRQQQHHLTLGENLWQLANEHYQDPLLWPHIYQANIQTIDNPNFLREGSTITIPSLQGHPGNLSRDDRRKIAEGYYLTYQYYQKTGRDDAFFALLQAKRYDASVVKAHQEQVSLSFGEELLLAQQQTLLY